MYIKQIFIYFFAREANIYLLILFYKHYQSRRKGLFALVYQMYNVRQIFPCTNILII
jgi:hypothetical protein